jgi:transcription termination factor Rho
MSEEQLERSILERKASDELRAIATAMSLEPVARSRKADLVNQILRAAGVEVEDASGAHTSAAGSAQAPAANGAAAVTAPAEAPAAKPARGRSSRARSATKTTSTESPANKAGSNGHADGPVHGLGEGRDNSSSADSTLVNGSGPAVSDRVESPVAEAAAAILASSDAEMNGGEPATTTGAAAAEAGRAGQAGAAANGETSDRANGDNSTNYRPQRQPQQHGQPGRGGQGAQGGQGGQVGQIEPGNRRGRRRRGRDRERGGQEPQGGGQEVAWQGELVPVRGLLDLRDEGYGFLRTSGYLPSLKDVYISVSQARRFSLRRGDAIEGACRPAGPSEKYPALLRIDSVCGMTPDEARERPRFEDLTPLFPDQRMRLELKDDPLNTTARIVDLISPIGKGQRSMIVSPPKAGKTTILKQIAHSIEQNDPSVHRRASFGERRGHSLDLRPPRR